MSSHRRHDMTKNERIKEKVRVTPIVENKLEFHFKHFGNACGISIQEGKSYGGGIVR